VEALRVVVASLRVVVVVVVVQSFNRSVDRLRENDDTHA
jgi:hypothetical protein